MPGLGGLPTPGTSLGPYVVGSLLGRGGMGAVFVARHGVTGAKHALKILRVGPVSIDERALARFRREVEVLARIDDHPSLVRVHSSGFDRGIPWCAMELVDGISLDQRLDTGGVLPVDEAVRLVASIARAIDHAHRCGVVHRDLKPGNVLIDRAGAPRVVDFGLAYDVFAAELTKTGECLGTPAFMAPEQVSRPTAGGPDRPVVALAVGPPTDVYGLGGVLYACLTGRAPVEGTSAVGMLAEVVRGERTPPSRLAPATPPAIDAITLRCLAKRIEARFATAGELADDLERFLRGEPVETPVASVVGRRLLPRSRGGRMGALAAAVAVTLVAAAVLPIVWFRADPIERVVELEAALSERSLTGEEREELEALVSSFAGERRTHVRARALAIAARIVAEGEGGGAAGRELALVVRPGGEIDRPALARTLRVFRAHGRLDAVAAVLWGALPSAPPPPTLAGELAAAIARGELDPPGLEGAFVVLLRAPGLDAAGRGRLLVRRAERLLVSETPDRDAALDCYVRAFREHAVVADRWPRELRHHALERFLDAVRERRLDDARPLAGTLARTPGADAPIPIELLAGLQSAAGVDTLASAALDRPSEEEARALLLLGSVLEAHAGWPVHYDMLGHLAGEVFGVEQLLLIGREEMARPVSGRDPGRLLFVAALLQPGGANDDAVARLARGAVEGGGAAAWHEALAGLLLVRQDRIDEGQALFERSWERELARPEAERRPYSAERLAAVLIDRRRGDHVPAAVVRRGARLALEAARLQRVVADRFAGIRERGAMLPWPSNREYGISEVLALTAERLVALPSPGCCGGPDPGDPTPTPSPEEIVAVGVELTSRPMARLGRAVDYYEGGMPPSFRLLTTGARHHLRHGRADEALVAIDEALRIEMAESSGSGQAAVERLGRISSLHADRAMILEKLGRPQESLRARGDATEYRRKAGGGG